jgi:AcrR family transcriptional regulator
MCSKDLDRGALLLEQATALVAREGIDALTLRKLAEATGLPISTLYTYYRSKEILLKELSNRSRRNYYLIGTQAAREARTLRAGVWAIWKGYYDFTLENPYTFELVDRLRGINLSPPQPPSYYKEQFQETLHTFIRASIQRGELPDMPDHVFWALVYGPLHTLLRYYIDLGYKNDEYITMEPKVLRQTFERVLRSLTPYPRN